VSGPTPTLAQVIRAALRAHAADLHVAIPASVERVDLALGQVDARPLVKDLVGDQEAALRALAMPVITNVPIVWPGAGGCRLTFPLAVGDTVLLLFADRSLDVWLAKGGEVDPGDPRRHALSDAVAIPGLRPFSAPWAGAAGDGVTLGAQEGPWQPAALGQDVRDELDDLRAKFASHTHPVSTTGTATAQAGTAAPTTTTLDAAKPVVSGTVKLSE